MNEKLTISITNNFCWGCGEVISKGADKTYSHHHAIPLRLKPKRNIIIPVCDTCHLKINSEDSNGMIELLKSNMIKMRSLMRKYELVIRRLNIKEQFEKEAGK